MREDFPVVFGPIVDKAREHGLKIALENWYATNLQGLDHFKIAFEKIPDRTLGLNFDPSHLFNLNINSSLHLLLTLLICCRLLSSHLF
ncbi:TIM barrel protein [Candidatus Bathyarchaeota archaeon]|nr:TIM barrel protein [Candidatus Bathyarchaeota archaeon]